MKDLFRSEWRRLRRLALIAALVHSLVLLFMSRVMNVLQLQYDDQAAMLAVYMVLGLALSLVQVGSYRKPSQWQWLMHRPLPPAKIFQALALAALALLAVTVLAPLLLFVLGTDLLTTQVVDSRHYVSLLHALAFTMMAWFACAHAVVSQNKAVIAMLVAPFVLAMHLASVWALLFPVALCLAWLGWLAMRSFRADRAAPTKSASVLLLTALPLQLALFLLVFHMSKLAVGAAELMAGDTTPTQAVLATDPDSEAAIRAFSQNFVRKGLADSRDPHAAEWREQLPLLEAQDLMPDLERFPVRHQISNLRGTGFWDGKRSIEWTFSHDRMLYRGRDPRTGADRGTWGSGGVGGAHAYTQMPLARQTAQSLFVVDDATQRQHEILRLPPGENFVARPTRALGRVLVLTSQRLAAYREDTQEGGAFSPLQPDWQLPLDVRHGVPQVTVVELLDGWLVSIFYFVPKEFLGFESLVDPWQQVVHVDSEGVATVVGTRHDIRDHHAGFGAPPLVPTTSWWLSPVLYVLARFPESAFDKGQTQALPLDFAPPVPIFWSVAAALMLLSLALAAWWLRRTPATRARKHLWLASCAVLGLPAFLSLMCLERRVARR